MIIFVLIFAPISFYLASIVPAEYDEYQKHPEKTKLKGKAVEGNLKFKESRSYISINRPPLKVYPKHKEELYFDKPSSYRRNDKERYKNVGPSVKYPVFIKKLKTKQVKSKTFSDNEKVVEQSICCNIS